MVDVVEFTAQWRELQEKFLSFFPADQTPVPFPPMPNNPSAITPAFDSLRENNSASLRLTEQNETKTTSKPSM